MLSEDYEILANFSGLKSGTILEGGVVKDSFVEFNIAGSVSMIPAVLLKKIQSAPKKKKVGLTLSGGEIEGLQSILKGAPKEFTDETEENRIDESASLETVEVIEIKLKEGEFYLSTVTGGRLPESGIDHVLCAFPYGTWSEEEESDIPDVDPNYYWDANLLESMWISFKLNKKMLLTGYPGTGKTTAVRQFGAWIKQPVMRFNGKDGIEASSFLGYPWAVKGGMEWKDGMLPIGVRKGYLVTIDEVFKIPAGIQMAMQSLYEEDGYLTLDDNPDLAAKNVYPHSNFRMFLTDNVKGTGDDFDKFSATQVQDSSTLDRFGITATVQYLPQHDEVIMLTGKYPKVPETIIEKLVRFAGLIREGYAKGGVQLTMSPRGLQTICEIVDTMELPVDRAIQMTFMDKLGEADDLDFAEESYRACF